MPSNLIPSNRKFPLRKIFLRNFKSVKDSDVTISPLTVVVGANSSGKSTLLQSILSISQAIGKDLNGLAYPLNGEKILLGTFAETKSFFARDSNELMQIGFELETTYVSFRNFHGGRQRTMRAARARSRYRGKFKFDLIKSGSEESGTAQIGHISIESEREHETGSNFMKADLNFDPNPEIDDQQRAPLIFCSGNVYNSVINKTYSVDAATFKGVIPTTMYERGDQATFSAEEIFNVVTEVFADELKKEEKRLESSQLSDQELLELETSVVEIVSPIYEDLEENSSLEPDEDDETTWMSRLDAIKSFENEIKKLSGEKKSKLVTLVAKSNVERLANELDRSSGLPFLRKELCFRPILEEVANTSSDLSHIAKQLFRFNTNYLAPIRLTPKVNYEPSSGRPDVGSTGEYTAYVLHTRGKQYSTFPLPNGSRESVSLNVAVNRWLEFFGLASGAKTIDNGKLGIGLRLNLLNGGYEVDLTSVGVGVSQVLPVLVSCLMAKSDTILLIEQPELHLHPKLQMDLADFLIACCKFGTQIIIETHSEHIVNRIRRRIAEGDDRELEDLVGILFVEQSNGVTQYRSPSINKFGGLGSDWPDGFLDVGAGEMENLLGAGLAKRNKKRN